MPTRPIKELEEQVGESNITVEGLAVEAGKVEEFARAIGDENSVHRDPAAADEQEYPAVPAPLTFTRTNYFPRYRPEKIDHQLGFNLGLRYDRVVHGEHEYEFERPIYVGDVLSGETTLVNVYQREGCRGGAMTFVVYKTEYRDENNNLTLTEWMTRIETGGAINEDGSNDNGTDETSGNKVDETGRNGHGDGAASDDTVALDGGRDEPVQSAIDISLGDQGPEVIEDLERQDFVQYAGASGDFNPIHYDEPYAKAAGNPSVFGQGMLTAGYAARVATDWFGIGAIESFCVRFQARVWPNDTVTASGEVINVERWDEGVTADVDLVVTNQDNEAVLTGRTTARLHALDNTTENAGGGQ